MVNSCFFVVPFQIDTMKCSYCPQKGGSVVPWGDLSSASFFLQRKYPAVGEGAACDLCVRSAQPKTFCGPLGGGFCPATHKAHKWVHMVQDVCSIIHKKLNLEWHIVFFDGF